MLQLNDALAQISVYDPEIEYRLYNKYFGATRTALSLTGEETAYLEDKGTLRAVITPQLIPMLWIEDGSYKGIYADIVNLISRDLGINIEIIQTNSYKETIQKIKNGDADIIMEIHHDYSWAEENHVNLTTSFLSLPFSMIMRKEKLPENPSVAVVDGYFFSERKIKTLYPSNRIVRYSTAQEVLDALREGKQDIAYLNSFFVQGIILDRKYQNLSSDFNIGFSSEIAIGVNEKANKILTVILDKEIGVFGRKPNSGNRQPKYALPGETNNFCGSILRSSYSGDDWRCGHSVGNNFNTVVLLKIKNKRGKTDGKPGFRG